MYNQRIAYVAREVIAAFMYRHRNEINDAIMERLEDYYDSSHSSHYYASAVVPFLTALTPDELLDLGGFPGGKVE